MDFDKYRDQRLQQKAAVALRGKDQSNTHRHLVDHPPKKVFHNGMLWTVHIYEGDKTWRCQLVGSSTELLIHEAEWTIVESCNCEQCWKRERRKTTV